jgi:chromosome segregation ATPase
MKKLSLLTVAAVFSILFCTPVLIQAQSVKAQSEDVTEAINTAREAAQEKRKNKEARIEEIKAQVAARKLQIKEAACERAEAKLNTTITRVSNNANKIKSVIDKKYERVQEFYASGQLTTPDYDELVAAIELSKANAEASQEALESYVVEIDCTSEEAGGQLDAFRSAAAQTKEDLKTYRKDLVALISALQSANSNKNRTGGEDTGDSGDEDTTDEEDNENGGETTE